MILISLVLSGILFLLFDTDHFRKQVAVAELGGFATSALTEETYQQWLHDKGLTKPIWFRYSNWLINLAHGDLGMSLQKNRPVAELLADRLIATGILTLCLFLIMIPVSLLIGVVSGMREHSRLDKVLSTFSIITTSIPEVATATFLTIVFSFGLYWLPSKSAMINGFEFKRLILPVLTLLIYDFGYIARITRSSVIQVCHSPYVRTAILKGVGYWGLIFKHILRNALIVPFTVIVLQLNWLLSGIVVVEYFFQYNGFGRMLLEAALYGDILVIQAASLVAVIVAVGSQLISDIGYILINPKLRFKSL